MSSNIGGPRSPNGSRPAHQDDGQGPSLYRLDSNQSSTSVFEDVEMAHDEVSDLRPAG